MLRGAEETAINHSSTNPKLKYNVGTYDIYWLGLTIVIGGQLIYWNEGLEEGFWPYFLTVFFVGSGYLCLTFCLAEMTSFLPFAGGSYGYARCALGPIPGFLVGICETIEYVLYVTSAVLELGNLISYILNYSPAYEPLYWLLFFIISLFIQVYSQRLFWTFNMVIAAITLILILIYFFASIPAFDYGTYLHERKFRVQGNGGMTDFMYYFPLASWFYVGVEVMTLSCSEVKDAGRVVPKAMAACMITLFITSFLILFGTCLQNPGPYALPNEFLPLNPGYRKAFKISSELASILAIPGTFATAFGFMFAYGRQIYSMSTSGLFPHFLSKTYGDHKAPITALFLGSTLSFGSLLFLWYLYPNFSRQLFNLCMLGSCSVYVALFRSYIVCRKRYSNLPRLFKNSFGTFSAIYGMVVFSFMIVALAFFQQDQYISITVFVSFIVVFLLYYFLVVQKREFFSDEEQAKFMKAYILNVSEKRRNYKNNRIKNLVASIFPFLSSKKTQNMNVKKKNGFGSFSLLNSQSASEKSKTGIMGSSKKVRPLSINDKALVPSQPPNPSKRSTLLESAFETFSSFGGTNKVIPFSHAKEHAPNKHVTVLMDSAAHSASHPNQHAIPGGKSLFFNVNGHLIQLTESKTTVIQC